MPKLRVNNALWLISDTHFGHKNIIKFQQRPQSHEAIMLSEWIRRVGEHDQILHLGDVWMGSPSNSRRWADIVARLPGEKFLIFGNHDTRPPEMYEQAGFTRVDPFIYAGYAFTHRPVGHMYALPWIVEGDWHTNIHGHTHANVYTREHDGDMFAGKEYINVCVEHTKLCPVQLGNVWNLAKGAS